MPSQIAVLTGPAVGTVFPIEETVLRIGSDAQCSVRLDDIAPHAVTLRFHDGQFTILNRSNQIIELEGNAIPDRDSATWEPGQDLQLSTDVILQLQVEDDPTPVRKQAPVATNVSMIGADADALPEEIAAALTEDDDESASGSESKTGQQLMLLGLLVAAFAGLMYLDANQSAGEPVKSPQEIQQEYESLIKDVDAHLSGPVQPADQPFWEMLRTLLQDSRIQEVRGHTADAAGGYQRLRQLLLPLRDRDGGFGEPQSDDDPLTSRLDSFATERLDELGQPSA